jgi:hypothetical protein
MLEFLRSSGLATERKLRLFVCASTRLVWDWLPPGLMREAVEVAEQYADGLVAASERYRFISTLLQLPSTFKQETGQGYFAAHGLEVAAGLCGAVVSVRSPGVLARMHESVFWREHTKVTGQWQPALLRDIFGNPFNPVTLDPLLLTPAILQLARSIYEGLTFERARELADALEEAGLTNATLLEHLREPGGHVRGCHGIDAVLGRS